MNSAVYNYITQQQTRSVFSFPQITTLASQVSKGISEVRDYLGLINLISKNKFESGYSYKSKLGVEESLLPNYYNLFKGKGIDAEIITRKVVIKETNRLTRIILDIYKNNSILLTVSPREFEEIIAELLHSQGFVVDLTKQTRDNGYDILALKRIQGHVPLKFLVECKRYTSIKIGISVIREFKEVVESERANRGIIVTSSYLTKEAKRKINEARSLLDFKERDQVIDWIKDYLVNNKTITHSK